MEAQKPSLIDWVIFLIATIVFVSLCFVAPQWCWLPIPFVGTFLVKATGYM
ncbi:MAG: hypothetical protein KDC34_20480 [Saprospiraceae bacterium]|nr:hypothetical protein [Saprospiraceae bacterium]